MRVDFVAKSRSKMRAPKNDEFLEGDRARQGKSLTPPDPQLTIVKIDNIQKNNKKKQTN